jgi:hypothetical protein
MRFVERLAVMPLLAAVASIAVMGLQKLGPFFFSILK